MPLTNATSPASITATGTLYFPVADNATVAFIQLSGTYTTLSFTVQGSYDATNVFALACIDNRDQTIIAGSATISPTDSTVRSFIVPCAGMSHVGVNVTGPATGTGVFTFYSNSYVGYPLVGTTNVNNTTSGAQTFSSTVTVTSTSASALAVGANGATNPVLSVNANTASVATGLTIIGAAAASGVALTTISSGTNENLTINAKGSGTVTINGTATGNINLGGGGGRVVVPGTLTAGGLLTCAVQVATSGPLIYSGSGAPSISAAVQGSIYLRTDGSSTSTRMYVATNTAGAWAAVTTAS